MMFFNLFGRIGLGMDFRRENSKTPKKEASEYWYIMLTSAISDKTENKMAPLLAAGL